MMYQSKTLCKTVFVASAACFSLFGLTSASFSSEGENQKSVNESSESKATNNLLPGQRIVYGTVEGVNENTIKVNAGEVGEMSPRYLELEKLEGKADEVKQGDRLKITVNNKNKVVDYQLANKKH